MVARMMKKKIFSAQPKVANIMKIMMNLWVEHSGTKRRELIQAKSLY